MFIVNFSGYIQKFTLDKKGHGTNEKDTFQLTLKVQKGVVAGQTAKFTLGLNNVPSSVTASTATLLLLDGLVFTKN